MKGIFKLTIVFLIVLVMCGCTDMQVTTFPADFDNASNTVPEWTESTIEEGYPQVHETEPADLVGIEIDGDDAKKKYGIGEKLDTTNLLVYALYSDDTRIELNSEEFTISDIDTSTYGTKKVTVKYGEFEENLDVEVIYTVKDVDATTKYTTTDLDLREGPSTQFSVVTTLPVNTGITVIGEVDNGWMMIDYNEKECFCSANYLSATKTIINYDNIVVGEPGTSDKVVANANSYWNKKVPDWLKKKFVDNGWKMVVSKVSLAERFGYKMSIAGCTDYYAKTVYLDNRNSVIKRCLLHELGHVVDDLYGYVSDTDEFYDIFISEKEQYANVTDIGDGHATSDPNEYFASVFSDILMYGDDSIGDIPRTYGFVIQYIG